MTNGTTKKVIEVLNMNQDRYEDMILEIYINWCNSFSVKHDKDLQCLLANSALNTYFLYEYGKLVFDFLELLPQYSNTTGITNKDILKLYSKCTYKIFQRFSKTLIEKAKKTNITKL